MSGMSLSAAGLDTTAAMGAPFVSLPGNGYHSNEETKGENHA
jgi:hypothetical protein